ncbi:MAG: transcriptional regulator [Geminicoccaceae bacterium]
MPLTRSFKDTVTSLMQRDPAFKEALLAEATQALLGGDVDTGKALLRDYVHGTIGFQALGSATGASPKSLMRMLGPKGNPQAKNLFAVLHELQSRTGIYLEVRPR